MPDSHSRSILITGTRNWLAVMAELFRRAGIRHDIAPPPKRGDSIRHLIRTPYKRYDAIHHVGGPWDKKTALTMRLARRPIIWHWIGSDVGNYGNAHGANRWICRRAANHWATAHLADSPELGEELAQEGITARVVRLLPKTIEADPLPLPETFAVLSYWGDGAHFEFYGGEIVLRLATEFPDIPFHIVGAKGRGVCAPPNVCFHGFVEDIDDLYRRTAVLIRMPKRDSLSAMVLEMLARGRYAIYNKPLDGCHLAQTYEKARAVLGELRLVGKPNAHGAAVVRERFSIDREAETLRRIYDELLGPGGAAGGNVK